MFRGWIWVCGIHGAVIGCRWSDIRLNDWRVVSSHITFWSYSHLWVVIVLWWHGKYPQQVEYWKKGIMFSGRCKSRLAVCFAKMEHLMWSELAWVGVGPQEAQWRSLSASSCRMVSRTVWYGNMYCWFITGQPMMPLEQGSWLVSVIEQLLKRI